MEKKSLHTLRYTMKKEDIMSFVSGLHDMQADMINEAVAIEERKGFPQVKELLSKIMVDKR